MTALTAVNLLVFAVVLALPVLAIPAFVRGAVNRSLLEAGAGGHRGFAVTAGVGAVLLSTDRPLRWVGRVAQRVRNRVRPKAEPLTGLPARLLGERDQILDTLGPKWKHALLATVGRWVFDYMSLLAALAAIGSHPRPSLVLLAFCARAGAGEHPDHARRAGIRRGRPHDDARARGRRPGRRRPRDLRLPPVLVLAPAAVRPGRAGDRAAAAS